jgi:hypothetical protein
MTLRKTLRHVGVKETISSLFVFPAKPGAHRAAP